MLDRLVRGAVLTETNGVMGHHMNDADPHQGGKTDCGRL